jgi:hypothetical protein
VNEMTLDNLNLFSLDFDCFLPRASVGPNGLRSKLRNAV